MRYLSPLVPFAAVALGGSLLSCAAPAVAYDFDSPSPYSSNPYGQRWNAYPDSSSRPLNPGPGGRWNDDEYWTRKQQEYRQEQQQRHRTEPVTPPPAAHDFNVWKDGKPSLCTATKQDVYCY